MAEGNVEIPKIVRGNDFTVRVLVKRNVASEEGMKQEDIDLGKCNSIVVRRVTRLGRRIPMSFTTDGPYVVIPFEEDVPSGSYGLEVAGRYPNGQDWRFSLKPGEFLNIVEATSDGDTDGATVKDVYEYSAVLLGESLSDAQLTELVNAAANANAAAEEASNAAKAASDAAEKATEVIGSASATAEAAKDATDKATQFLASAEDRQTSIDDAENARVEAEKMRVSAENQRDIHEQQRLQGENARVSSEKARATNESGRQTAEAARDEAETKRVSAENQRDIHEQQRQNADKARETALAEATSAAEKTANDAKKATERATDAEAAMVEAEAKRVSAENQRNTDFSALKTSADNVITAANDAAERANKAADAVENKVKETLTISLSCNHDENIMGKKVYVKNSEDDSTLEEHEWQGETIKIGVMPDQKYYVECEALEGYSLPKSGKYTAISGNVREVDLAYESEWFYPTLQMEDGTDCDGTDCVMVYNRTGKHVNTVYKKGMCVKVPMGQYYQLVPVTKSGYYSGMFVSHLAKDGEYHATATYRKSMSEIGIQMLDGTVIAADDWDDTKYSKENVNGILVCTQFVQCVMSLQSPALLPFGGQGRKVPEGCDVQASMSLIKGQLGESNTEALVKDMGDASTYAAGYCYNVILKSGKRCYLPAEDEGLNLYTNRAAINKCSQKIIGRDIIGSNAWFWSSTLYNASSAWYFTSGAGTSYRSGSYQCLPVSAL